MERVTIWAVSSDVGGENVTNVWNLGLVCQEDPVALEDVAHFQVKKFLVSETLRFDANHSVLGDGSPVRFCSVSSEPNYGALVQIFVHSFEF